MAETILITGASSGFGKDMTHALRKAAHEVAASMRDPDGRNRAAAQELSDIGAHIVDIDVTDHDSVHHGVAAAVEALGGLTVVVNNAGIGASGLVEAFTPGDFQRLFEVNVFGVQRVNRAVAPLLRAQGKGLLVHISSLLGRITLPFYGPYTASKWALEAIVEGYRSELSSFGVESVLIEPGGFPTTFRDRLMRPSDQSRDGSYGAVATEPQVRLEGFHHMLLQTPVQDPRLVADAVVDVVGQPHGARPFRTPVDRLGMGDAVAQYNGVLDQVTQGIYQNMDITHMLQVNTSKAD